MKKRKLQIFEAEWSFSKALVKNHLGFLDEKYSGSGSATYNIHHM